MEMKNFDLESPFDGSRAACKAIAKALYEPCASIFTDFEDQSERR